jgi:hypothetical protein
MQEGEGEREREEREQPLSGSLRDQHGDHRGQESDRRNQLKRRDGKRMERRKGGRMRENNRERYVGKN